MIRALEVFEQTGVPMSRQNHAAQDRPFRVLPLALDWPRELLYARLETRVHRMMEAGLLREVGALLESGVPRCPVHAGHRLQGTDSRCHGAGRCGPGRVGDHRAYAPLRKRQGTWLRAEPRCMWLDARDADALLAQAASLAQAFLNDTKEQEQ